MDSTAIVTTVATGIISFLTGGGLVAAGKIWLDSRKQDNEHDLAEGEQAISQYDALVSRLETRIITLEEQHKRCVEDHVKAMRELGRLEGMIQEQRDSMQHLREINTRQNMKAIEVAAKLAAKGVEVAAGITKPDTEKSNTGIKS